MARRYEDEPNERDDDGEAQRRRNERRLGSDRDWYGSELEGSGRYGERDERSAYGDDNRRSWRSGRFGEGGDYYARQPRGYYSEQVAGRQSFGEGGWARNPSDQSRWVELRQSYGQTPTSPYAPVYRSAAPQGGFAGKGPRGYVRSDERIREDVSDRLSWDDQVDASEITVTVSEGEVTLEGTVPDRASKRRAEDISEDVMGVKDVHNRLKAHKGLIQEVGDKLMGKDPENHGYAGSGTRNQPAGGSLSNAQNSR